MSLFIKEITQKAKSQPSQSYQFSLHIVVGEFGSIKNETVLSSIPNHKGRLGGFTKVSVGVEKAAIEGNRKLTGRIRGIEVV
jgi:hypothetical protein